MSAIEKINGKTRPWQRRRFEKRPDELVGERIKAERTALKQRIAKRTPSKSEDHKGSET